jgi:hypothetical protein
MMTRINLFKQVRVHLLLMLSLLLVLMLLGACTAAGEVTPQESQTAVPTVEPVLESTPDPTMEPAPEVTLEPVMEPTPEPIAEATPDPTHYFPTEEEVEEMMLLARYLLNSIPQPIAAPDGWEIYPCEGMAPLLCIQTGEEVGSSELGVYALRTYPDFYPILEEHGIPFGSIDVESQAYQEGARPALEEHIARFIDSMAEDRRIGRPQWNFIPLEVEPIQFGELPGLQFGFIMTDSDGVVHERVLSHAAFDESHIYFFVAVYDPDALWALPSDEVLLTFEPYLRAIIADLPLPKGSEWQQ